jgi:hypothetical protein
MNRSELIAQALLLGDLPGFQHRPELRRRLLLELLNDDELRVMVTEAVEEFRAAFR